MRKYVIRREPDGAFVADPETTRGSSYTRDLTKARTWATAVDAACDRCGNEIVMNVDDLTRPPRQEFVT